MIKFKFTEIWNHSCHNVLSCFQILPNPVEIWRPLHMKYSFPWTLLWEKIYRQTSIPLFILNMITSKAWRMRWKQVRCWQWHIHEKLVIPYSTPCWNSNNFAAFCFMELTTNNYSIGISIKWIIVAFFHKTASCRTLSQNWKQATFSSKQIVPIWLQEMEVMLPWKVQRTVKFCAKVTFACAAHQAFGLLPHKTCLESCKEDVKGYLVLSHYWKSINVTSALLNLV